MGSGLVLSADLKDGIENVLAMLQRKTQANCILLADISGQLISQTGALNQLEMNHFAALAASNMAATTEMAKMVGEKKRFKLLFHEGECKNVYLSNVGDSFLLVVVFSASVQIGLVRLYTKQAVERLVPLGAEFEKLQPQMEKTMSAEFGSALAEVMDLNFGGEKREE